MTNADDSRWDPPLDQLADVCTATALMVRDISRLPPREPSGDLTELDAAIDQGAGINVLKLAHEATTGYLQGAGDLLHSIARLVHEHPSALSPSVLARCTAEYSAFAWWLSDPTETPHKRATKSRRAAQTGFHEHTMNSAFDPLRKKFNTWSSQTNIKMGSKPEPEQLIRAMLGNAYTNQIKSTSQYVHPDLVTVLQTIVSADLQHPRTRQVTWNDSMFALWAVIVAAERVMLLRDGDLAVIEGLKRAFNHLADQATGDHQ